MMTKNITFLDQEIKKYTQNWTLNALQKLTFQYSGWPFMSFLSEKTFRLLYPSMRRLILVNYYPTMIPKGLLMAY